MVALTHIELDDASGQLAADAHSVAVGLALNGRRGGLDEQKARNGEAGNDYGKQRKSQQERTVAFSHYGFLFFHLA